MKLLVTSAAKRVMELLSVGRWSNFHLHAPIAIRSVTLMKAASSSGVTKPSKKEAKFDKNSKSKEAKGAGTSRRDSIMFVKEDDVFEEGNTMAAF